MNKPVFLDMTRAAGRRWNGAQPTGIDRVCDAYAEHFAQRSIAVIQIRGRAVILNRAASDMLMLALDLPHWQFRKKLVAALAMSAAAPLRMDDMRGAYYINVGHSDFDLDAHWRWIERSGLRPIYLLHDLIPITNPSVTTPRKSARHKGRVESAIKEAAGIVANSQTTANALRDFARQQGLVLPPLLISLIAGGKLPTLRAPLHTDVPEFVAIGTIERRKNPQLLLRVWKELHQRHGDSAPRLVFAGSLGEGGEEVLQTLENNPSLSRCIKVESDLDDRAMARQVARAHAVLLPSFAEGYGLPLVEALEKGIPVIGSDLASFRELGQGIPTLLHPKDDEAWIEAISDFAQKGTEFQRQVSAIGSFKPPSWPRHFERLDAWLEALTRQAETQFVPSQHAVAVA